MWSKSPWERERLQQAPAATSLKPSEASKVAPEEFTD